MDAGESAHPKPNKYQDALATADPKGPKDLDADSSFSLKYLKIMK